MAISLTGKSLTIEDVEAVARRGESVELHPDAQKRILVCREFVEQRIEAREIMYGVNTGIGEFSEVVLDDDQVREFQRYLIYNHAAGIGDPAPIDHVRAAMLLRANIQAHGYSACRLQITETLLAMLNRGVTPVVCEKGSVGACGDLAPMSQIALLMMGEGEAFYQGGRLPGAEALDRAGIPIPGLNARDGLTTINGSNLLTAIGALALFDTERWIKQAEIAAAMSLEALRANMKPYDARLHEMRGFQGAVTTAANLRQVMEGSDLLTGKEKVKVQDAYSMRSTPQDAVDASADRDRDQRSRRQSGLPTARSGGANRRQLPGDRGEPADRHAGCGHHHGLRALRAPPEPADESGTERRPSTFPDQGSGHVLGDDAQPVHG
jgi:histidine ammonia-lyase